MFVAAPGSGGGRIAESAKARTRRASLLGNDDFTRLLELTSVSEIAVYLGKSAYAPMLKGFALDEMRRADLEFLLGASILAEGVTFGHYGGQTDKNLLDMWLEYFDIMLFKSHFRHKLGTGQWDEQLEPDRVLEMVGDFHLSLVDKDKLFSGSTIKDLIMSVKNGDLRAALFEAVPGRESAASAQPAELQKVGFDTGMILDRYYLNNLYMAVAGLGGTEGKLLRQLVGTRVDFMNIYWIYRARRFFNLSPEEALTLIIKARYRADFDLLKKIAFTEPAAMKGALAGTPYAAAFETVSGDTALREFEIECHIYRVLFALAERVFLSGSLGFQNVAAYLILKELEVRDLVLVAEAVRYGFDRTQTSRLLVRPLGKVN